MTAPEILWTISENFKNKILFLNQEMAPTMYANMNKWIKEKKRNIHWDSPT
jgi:hypothetical protein